MVIATSEAGVVTLHARDAAAGGRAGARGDRKG
jgi:hypothetical protein